MEQFRPEVMDFLRNHFPDLDLEKNRDWPQWECLFKIALEKSAGNIGETNPVKSNTSRSNGLASIAR